MSVQAQIMRNRALTNAVMSRIPPASHQKRGRKYAVRVAQTALERTRAYPEYLKACEVSLRRVSDMADFEKLPLTDKDAYVDRYDLKQLCLDGKLTSAYTIERSSGHSGGSYYWLRLPEEDALFPSYLDYAFVQFYGVDRKATLVLITLSLGTWTSGEKMAQALRQVAAGGKYPLTVMAPGTNLTEILEIVSDLAPLYDQTVIVGYPPFIATVIEEGARHGLDWHSLDVRLGLGGESYSEEWRTHMASLIGVDPNRDLLAVSGGYGAADVGMSIGREYPATVLIRRLCTEDRALAKDLFPDGRHNHGALPSLCQYNPASCYIESVDDELVFTVLSGIPLVRYNIHDAGNVHSFDHVMSVLHDHGYDLREQLASLGYGTGQIWQLPFFHVFGRSDGTVSIVGANVSPENIHSALAQSADRDIATFKLGIETTDDVHPRLVISLEHRGEELTDVERAQLSSKYHQILVPGLRAMNRDFRQSYDEDPEAADPIIRVHARGTGPFEGRNAIKNKYIT